MMFGAILIGTCDDEGVLAEGGCERREFGDGARAKDDARGGGEFETIQNSESLGKRLVSSTRVRGSAIMSATVSRHFA